MKPDRQHAKTPRWQSVAHLLRAQERRLGNQTLLRFEGRDLSFSQVESQTNRLANVLRTLGIQKKSKVAVMMPNGFEYPLIWLAIAKLGALMIPINIQYQASELEFVLNNAQADIAIAGRQQIETLKGLKSKCPCLRDIVLFCMDSTITGTRNLGSEMEEASAGCSIDAIQQDDLLNLQYTSGSTGRPKGVVLSHRNMVAGAHSVATYLKNSAGDRLLAGGDNLKRSNR